MQYVSRHSIFPYCTLIHKIVLMPTISSLQSDIHGLWTSAAVEVESAGMVGGTIIPGEPSGGVNSRAASYAAFLSAFLSASLLVVTY